MIGWYVHHHGYGHLTRFRAVQPHLGAPVVAFSSLPAPADLPAEVTWTQLPRDDDDFERGGIARQARTSAPTAGGALHWAPLGHPGHRARLAAVAEAAARLDLDAFVVDVSAEVAAFVRLLGVPTVVVTQPGDRSDAPHRLAFALADRVLAPWAAGTLPAPAAPAEKVRFVGGISRFDGRTVSERAERRLLFLGRTLTDAAFAEATALLEAAGWQVDAIGTGPDDRRDDPWPLLSSAAVVVSAAGQNSVADLAAANARAIVVPQERPFDEQRSTAATLARLGLAAVCEPGDGRALAARAQAAAASAPSWQRWGVPGAAARAAAVVAEAAAAGTGGGGA